ncbi:hypothetical protein ACFFX0_26855 [Citricoccus parietis]|uniref:Uncharacterized protein n=1 Tax=Citricoccus parietis TaxID=592307 RepID=A0ABV5G6N8_9MICC
MRLNRTSRRMTGSCFSRGSSRIRRHSGGPSSAASGLRSSAMLNTARDISQRLSGPQGVPAARSSAVGLGRPTVTAARCGASRASASGSIWTGSWCRSSTTASSSHAEACTGAPSPVSTRCCRIRTVPDRSCHWRGNRPSWPCRTALARSVYPAAV